MQGQTGYEEREKNSPKVMGYAKNKEKSDMNIFRV